VQGRPAALPRRLLDSNPRLDKKVHHARRSLPRSKVKRRVPSRITTSKRRGTEQSLGQHENDKLDALVHDGSLKSRASVCDILYREQGGVLD